MAMLVLSITNACNFNCRTCLVESGKRRRNEYLPISVLKTALPEAKKLGFFYAPLTGGEPCLHPDFEKIAKLIAKNCMQTGFVSNGSMLEKYKALVEKYRSIIYSVGISLDGATREVNDSIRQEGSFDKAVESIKYFAGTGINTSVMPCLNKLNMHQIEDIVKLSVNMGIKCVSFGSAIQTSLNKDIILSENEREKCASKIEELRGKHCIEILMNSSLKAGSFVDFCPALSLDSPTINPSGELMFCCGTIRKGAVIGSLKKKSFAELYKKGLGMAAMLKKTRVQMLAEGKKEPGFSTCEFCNKHLAKYIK